MNGYDEEVYEWVFPNSSGTTRFNFTLIYIIQIISYKDIKNIWSPLNLQFYHVYYCRKVIWFSSLMLLLLWTQYLI